ncbi:DUF1345 domain-containing protein [Labrys sp. KB_33_2]|uniref:DUF1345 domain-containing protein n=1 Tax=unclassified Labrys (in: a-proteobacteria) TaxID=2688601 RepID=UPI003EBCAA3E
MRHFLRPLTARPVLLWSLVAGMALGLVIPGLPWLERLLAGWCLATAIFVVIVSYKLSRLPPDRFSHRADSLDEGAVTILILSMLAAATSFAGVIFELQATKNQADSDSLSLPLMVATIVCSWFFIHTIFAIHYAHIYYNDGGRPGKPSLDFGGDPEPPDYWDFVYFSVAIGASSATSDTNLRSRPMRRIVAAHAVFSFFFNATILALAINIAAGLLGGN